MLAFASSVHKPAWYMIPARVFLLTIILTLLSFAVSLFLGIMGTLVGAKLRGAHPNMTFAYRHVALPVAGVAAAIVLVSAVVMEIRHYRRARVLEHMEQQMGRAS
jgi:divalent metal cation (Fe/Co/Zn/Cd) transporter